MATLVKNTEGAVIAFDAILVNMYRGYGTGEEIHTHQQRYDYLGPFCRVRFHNAILTGFDFYANFWGILFISSIGNQGQGFDREEVIKTGIYFTYRPHAGFKSGHIFPIHPKIREEVVFGRYMDPAAGPENMEAFEKANGIEKCSLVPGIGARIASEIIIKPYEKCTV